ncbi:uncharacterized protein [Chelonus insularis]|uniref:uncharacterized protein isoform X2 n=1 Tax=Chelonus insularis TaxID=460826 RepID=UPI00158D66A4|nr:uncharacterized protein LOC118064840 isoform X2 [Chelonus insularis]
MKLVFSIFQILLLILICEAANDDIDLIEEKAKDGQSDEVIDPNSLYYNKQTKQLNKVTKLKLNKNNDNMEDIDLHQMCNEVFNDVFKHQTNDIFEESFSRRLINILLSSVDFQENNNLLTGSILIELTSSELQQLRNFGLGKARIRDVDPFITSIFKASEKNLFYDISLFLRDIVIYLVMHKEIVIITCIVLYLTWLLLTVKWDIMRFFQASLFIIFITSFVIVYFQLLKNAEIKLTTKQFLLTELPVHCQPHLMSWWEKVWHMYGSFEDCQRYFEAREDSHFLHVTPAIALSHMISTFMLHPAEAFGDAISKFVYQTTKNFWTPLQIIFTPLMTIVIIVLSVVAFICIAGGSLRWYMWPFTLFSLGRSRNNEAQSLSSISQYTVRSNRYRRRS